MCENKHGNRFKDLTGKRFGYLEVICYDHTEKRNGVTGIYWKCICHLCKNECVKNGSDLASGRLKSDGCLRQRRKMERQAKLNADREVKLAKRKEIADAKNARNEMRLANLKSGVLDLDYNDPAFGLYGTRFYAVYKNVMANIRERAAKTGRPIADFVVPEWYIPNMSQVELRDSGNKCLLSCVKWSFENGYHETDPNTTPYSQELILIPIDNEQPLGPDNAIWVTREEKEHIVFKRKLDRELAKQDDMLIKREADIQRRIEGIYRRYIGGFGHASNDPIDKPYGSIEEYYAEERLRGIYKGVISRTRNHNRPSYQNYGGRNLGIDPLWFNPDISFEPWDFYRGVYYKQFREDAYNTGYRAQPIDTPLIDLLTIDRKNRHRGYFRDNCRWIPLWMQASNKTTTNFFDDGEEILSFADMVRKWRPDQPEYDARFIASKVDAGWSGPAILYALKHPEAHLRKTRYGYLDDWGFYVLLPNEGTIILSDRKRGLV